MDAETEQKTKAMNDSKDDDVRNAECFHAVGILRKKRKKNA